MSNIKGVCEWNGSLNLPSPTVGGIERFKALYRRRFGISLSDQEAIELATRCLHLVYFMTTPPPQGRAQSPLPTQTSSP